MSSCKTTNFPSGIRVGQYLELDPGTELPTFPEMIIDGGVQAGFEPPNMWEEAG